MPTKGQFKQPPMMEVQGNNGGSFVRIEPHEKDGLCYLEVGHECVIRVRREIAVTDLARIIADGLEAQGPTVVCCACGAPAISFAPPLCKTHAHG